MGDWSLDKRHYMANYPPRALEPPPACAGKAAHTLHRLFNEASEGIKEWPEQAGQSRGTHGWGHPKGGGGVSVAGAKV